MFQTVSEHGKEGGMNVLGVKEELDYSFINPGNHGGDEGGTKGKALLGKRTGKRT